MLVADAKSCCVQYVFALTEASGSNVAGLVWRSDDYGRAGSWKDITVIMPGVHATWCRSCISTSKAQLQLLMNCNTCMYSHIVSTRSFCPLPDSKLVSVELELEGALCIRRRPLLLVYRGRRV